MVVEDNDLNRKLFCDVLRAQGYEVEPVADGETALAVARQVQPHLIIMDIQLPRISGVDLIEQASRILLSLQFRCWPSPPLRARGTRNGSGRSEEHTSELQPLMRNSSAVFCLKTNKTDTTNI